MIDCSESFLLIDIGNSRTKWGEAKNGRIFPGEPFLTQCIKNNSETLVSAWRKIIPPAQVVVANVAGPACANSLHAWTEECWGLEPRFVRSEAEGFGVRNAYFNPGKLGVDRWVALIGAHHTRSGLVCGLEPPDFILPPTIGAHHAHPVPVCVADFGTAITVDGMDSEGVHLGGVIAPGLRLMRQSLVTGTSDLTFAGDAFCGSFARETASAIASGTLQAAAGLIERCHRETASKLGCEPRLLLTGGDAPAIAPLLGVSFDLRPELVLEGLLVITESGR